MVKESTVLPGNQAGALISQISPTLARPHPEVGWGGIQATSAMGLVDV